MKLLFDHNLSHKLIGRLADLFPDSEHVRNVNLHSVSCPGLPGCWSQGATEAEALENIQDAIRKYLAAVDDILEETPEAEVREVDVNAPL